MARKPTLNGQAFAHGGASPHAGASPNPSISPKPSTLPKASASPKPPALRRLAKPGSLSERIYEDLRGRLQRCEIAAEDRLVDTEIAGSYGTSRMPVREALMRLANEGYLVGTTRGFVLPRLSASDIGDIFQVRRLLEPAAAAQAAGHLDDAARRELTRSIEEARAAMAQDDAERLILANARFRAAWLGAVANRRLAETIARFVDHVQLVRLGTLTDAPTRPVVARGLEGLYDAFMRGDGPAAEAQMASFIAAAEQAFARGHRGEPAAASRRTRSTTAATPSTIVRDTARAAQGSSR